MRRIEPRQPGGQLKATKPKETIRFIADSASEQDFFGSHKPIAEAIATAIHESDVKMVGLLGPWGSGKSTVVRLLEAALNKKPRRKYYLFTYDAWLHQSDPHRRSFLDQLVAFAASQDLAGKDQWNDSLDVLNRRVETTEIDSTPLLTGAGRVLFGALLLLPLGLAFATRPWYDVWVKATSWRSIETYLFPAGLFLTILPMLLALGFFLWWRNIRNPFRRAFWAKENFAKHRAPHEKESILSIISNKHIQKQQSKLTKSPEPTAIEFQNTFRQILKDIADPNRRLVIVVDNLDRLSGDEALEMWSTIRSFFLGAVPPEEKLLDYALPVVVLPVDESAVIKAGGGMGKADGDGLARSFMDKTFDVVFHVSPPVLSNWSKYLARQMKFSFGAELEGDWLSTTERIYRHKADKGGAVTPRDINKTVSAILALWLQRKSNPVPFASIAYYAIFRTQIEKDLAMALNAPFVDLSDQDSDWQRSVAALYYGVGPDEAVQVLLDTPLRTMIVNKDARGFAARMSFPGFSQALQRILDDNGFMTGDIVSNAALVFIDAGAVAVDWSARAWRRLRSLFVQSDLWTDYHKKSAPTADRLITHCPENELASFLKAMRARIAEWPSAKFSVKDFSGNAALLIEQTAKAAAANGMVLSPLTLKANGDQYLEIISMLDRNSPALKLLQPPAEPLIAALAKQLLDPASHERFEEKAQAVLDVSPSDQCDPLVNSALVALQTGSPSQPVVSASALILGRLFSSRKDAQSNATQSAASGHLQALLNDRAANADLEGAARAATLMLLVDHQMGAPNGQAWPEFIAANPEFPSRVDALLQTWRKEEFASLFVQQVERDETTKAVFGPIMAARVRRADMGPLKLADIIADPGRYTQLLPPELHGEFFERLTGYLKFWERVGEAGLATGATTILTHLIGPEVSSKPRKQAKSVLLAALKAVNPSDWVTAIKGDAAPLGIARLLKERRGSPLALGLPLFEALNGLTPELIASEERPYLSTWFGAAELLGKMHRQTLFRNLRDQLLGIAAPSGLYDLLSAGGSQLIEGGDFAAKSDECVRHLVMPGLTPEGLPWLLEHRQLVKSWIGNASKETVAVAREKAISSLDKLEGEDRTRLELLMKSWP